MKEIISIIIVITLSGIASATITWSDGYIVNNNQNQTLNITWSDGVILNYVTTTTIDEEPPSGDSCTPPVSGTWEIDCSDNCIWSTETSIPEDITTSGTGSLTISNNFLMNTGYSFYLANTCNIYVTGDIKFI